MGYSAKDHKRVGHDLATQQQQQKTYSWSRDSDSVLRGLGDGAGGSWRLRDEAVGGGPLPCLPEQD